MLLEQDKAIGRELKSLLLSIRNSEDFADAVIANAETPENWERVIEFVNKGTTDVEEILWFSICIS